MWTGGRPDRLGQPGGPGGLVPSDVGLVSEGDADFVEALEEEEQLTDRQMGWSLGIGAAFFTALFILAPPPGPTGCRRSCPAT